MEPVVKEAKPPKEPAPVKEEEKGSLRLDISVRRRTRSVPAHRRTSPGGSDHPVAPALLAGRGRRRPAPGVSSISATASPVARLTSSMLGVTVAASCGKCDRQTAIPLRTRSANGTRRPHRSRGEDADSSPPYARQGVRQPQQVLDRGLDFRAHLVAGKVAVVVVDCLKWSRSRIISVSGSPVATMARQFLSCRLEEAAAIVGSGERVARRQMAQISS